MLCTLLYFTVLYCTVLYRALLYFTILRHYLGDQLIRQKYQDLGIIIILEKKPGSQLLNSCSEWHIAALDSSTHPHTYPHTLSMFETWQFDISKTPKDHFEMKQKCWPLWGPTSNVRISNVRMAYYHHQFTASRKQKYPTFFVFEQK